MLDVFDPLRSSEFPHDNPELFGGPGWLAVEPCGGPKAIAWASRRDLHYPAPAEKVAPMPGDRVAEPTPVTELPAAGAAQPATAEAEAVLVAEVTDFDRLVAAARSVVPNDADPRLATELEQFLRTGTWCADVFTPAARSALAAAGFVSDAGQGWSLSARARATAEAWRRLLSGHESDLAECGDRPLDEWMSNLVGACLDYDVAGTAALRRALRKRGVAAFGMLGG